MRRSKIGPAITILAAGLASLAPAQEERTYRDGRFLVHEVRGSVAGGGARVGVETDIGSVSVRGVPGTEVGYLIRVRASGDDEAAARRRLESLVISVSRSPERLLIRGQAGGSAEAEGLSAGFELTVPARASEIEVSTGGGDIKAENVGGAVLLTRGGTVTALEIAGDLRVESQGGNLEIGRVKGRAALATAGGRVRLASAGGDVVARTSGGDLSLGTLGRGVHAESGGGNIVVESADGDVDVATSGGNIEIGRAGGRLTAATAGGSIRVSAAGRGARCQTAGGSIDLKGIGGPVRAVTSAGSITAEILPTATGLAESLLQTWQGDVILVLPEDLPLTIRASIDRPFGRNIKSDFPLTVQRDSEGPGAAVEMAEGHIAGGGPILKARTLGGNITILKRRSGR